MCQIVEKPQNKVIFVKKFEERSKSNEISSNAKELDSILNKYKTNPKQNETTYGSFLGKKSSSGSLNSSKGNISKIMDSKRGSGQIGTNLNKSNASSYMNSSNPNPHSVPKLVQNYMNTSRDSQKLEIQRYENQNQNKVFKQLQYADQKNVTHRVSKQSPLKYEGSVRNAQQEKKNSIQSTLKLESNQQELKKMLFKENNKQYLNQTKYDKQQSQSPGRVQKPQETKSFKTPNDSFTHHSKSTKNMKDQISKSQYNPSNKPKQTHQHLDCYLGNGKDTKKLEPKEEPTLFFTPYKRSNSSETIRKQGQSHPRSKTELLTRSTSPQKSMNQDYQDMYVKMEEIECEQKELEMKQNILQQYKKLLQHKIETKDKQEDSKIKALQKNLQLHLNKMCLDNNGKSDLKYKGNEETVKKSAPIPKDDNNKKEIRWQLKNNSNSSKNLTQKSQKSPSPLSKNTSVKNSTTNGDVKKNSPPPKNDKSFTNNNNSTKQKILYSDVIKKLKDQKQGITSENQYKPSIPSILMKKLIDQGKQCEPNTPLSEYQQQMSPLPILTQLDQPNQQARQAQIQQAREEFIQKCLQTTKGVEVSQLNNNNTNYQIINNINGEDPIQNYNKTSDNFQYAPQFFNTQENVFLNQQISEQNQIYKHQNDHFNYYPLQNQVLSPQFKLTNTVQNTSPLQNQQFFPVQQLPSNIGELNTCSTVSYTSAREEDQNRIPSLPNFQVSENQWTTPVCSKSKISETSKQDSKTQISPHFNQKIDKKEQPIQNNYSSYTIYSYPQNQNRYGDEEENSGKENKTNLNTNTSEKLNVYPSIPNIIVTEAQESFTNLNRIDNQSQSPTTQNRNYLYVNTYNNTNMIGHQANYGNQSTNDENINKAYPQYNYIKQMIDQKTSTQNKNQQILLDPKNSFRDLQEPEQELNTNFRQQQNDIHTIYPDDLEESKNFYQQQLQYQNAYITPKQKNYNNNPFTIPKEMELQQMQQKKFIQNGIAISRDSKQSPIQSKQLSSKVKTPLYPPQKSKDVKTTQGILSARGVAGEKQLNPSDLVAKLLAQKQEVQMQIDRLLSNQEDENESFDIENQKFNGQNDNENRSRTIRETNNKSEKLQLLQFQLQEQLLLSLEEEERKTTYNFNNSQVEDISSRNSKWLTSKEEKIKKQKEQKAKKELDGCTFKPNLFTSKFQQDSKSPSRLTSTSYLDSQQKLHSNNQSSSQFLGSRSGEEDQQRASEKVYVLPKSQFGSSQVLSKQNSSPSNYLSKNKNTSSSPNKDTKEKMTYQMINSFKKKGSLHKLD